MIEDGTEKSDSTDSNSTVKALATVQRDPLYLYYRLFTTYIGIRSWQPGNPYVGRIRAKSVAPPQTVFLIKRHIFETENRVYDPQSALFLSKSCRSALADGERVSISPGGVGTNPEDPMELVITKFRDCGNPLIDLESLKPEYIYYSLYTEDGDITPKHQIGDYSPSVARIDKTLVPPPHSPDSIIRCISYVEGFPYCVWHRLFIDITSESPINYREAWIPESGGPGSTPDKPLIFVKFATEKKFIRPKQSFWCIKLYSASSESEELFGGPFPLYTDGVVRQEISRLRPPTYDNVYRVYNDAGVHGFALKDDVVLTDR